MKTPISRRSALMIRRPFVLGRSLLVAALVGSTAATSQAGVAYIDAPVLAVDPIYETIRFSEPREVCSTERVAVDRDDYREPRRGSRTVPLIGGVIGGAIGNAVGHNKSNKRVGAVVGALLGASIASDIARRDRGGARRASRYVTYQNREVCEIVDVEREEERVAGYDVSYEYAGRVHDTRMSRDPGATIRLRVDVTPVR